MAFAIAIAGTGRVCGAALMVLATLACASSPAAADGAFCEGLKAVAADAGRGFEAFRGAKVGYVPEDGGGDDSTRYAATRTLPQALHCGVDRDRSDGEDVLATYVCWFPSGRDGAARVGRLADEVVGCIGRAATDRVSMTAGRATADLRRRDYVISVSTNGPGGPVVLELGGR